MERSLWPSMLTHDPCQALVKKQRNLSFFVGIVGSDCRMVLGNTGNANGMCHESSTSTLRLKLIPDWRASSTLFLLDYGMATQKRRLRCFQAPVSNLGAQQYTGAHIMLSRSLTIIFRIVVVRTPSLSSSPQLLMAVTDAGNRQVSSSLFPSGVENGVNAPLQLENRFVRQIYLELV